MGGQTTKQRPEPVAGLQEDSCLSVIPVFRTSIRGSYTVPRITTLKLQKSHIWSVDSNILDYRGFYVFRKSGSAIGAVLEFSDDAGNVLATMEKKTTCRDSIASVVLGSSTEPGPPVATIHYRYAAGDSLATIVLAEEDSTVVAGPEIRVRGDFSSYHYTFHLDTGAKIAQVMSTLSEPHLYQLEVGPWVDIAFLTIAASCVDLLHLRALHSPLDHLCHWVSCLALLPDSEVDTEQGRPLQLHDPDTANTNI